MRAWLASLRNGFTGVVRFSGRDDRALYWPYVFTLLAALMAATMAVMLPMMAETMARMQRFAIEHPDQATITQGPGSYSISIHGNHPELIPDFAGMLGGTVITSLAFILLIAAATVRRLRDNGRGLWWGLPPLLFLTTGMVLMPKVMTSFHGPGAPRLDLFLLMFANNMAYLATLALLVFQLARAPRLDPGGAARR
jgi:uncharacterized membrane protein YhaH (DUF805 family)